MGTRAWPHERPAQRPVPEERAASRIRRLNAIRRVKHRLRHKQKKTDYISTCITDECIINLSSKDLSTIEKQLLCKGLLFIPKPKHIDLYDLYRDTNKFVSNMRYHNKYHGQTIRPKSLFLAGLSGSDQREPTPTQSTFHVLEGVLGSALRLCWPLWGMCSLREQDGIMEVGRRYLRRALSPGPRWEGVGWWVVSRSLRVLAALNK